MTTLTTASRLGAGAFCPKAAATVVVRHRHRPAREFRIGRMWTSYLEAASQRDMLRRHRQLRRNHAEFLKRRLSWEEDAPIEDARSAFKRIVRYGWKAQERRPVGRFWDVDVVHKRLVKLSNKEDVARVPWENHLYHVTTRTEAYPFNYRQSRLDVFGSSVVSQSSGPAATPSFTGGRDGSQDDTQYMIDPITNRKVPKTSGQQAVRNDSICPCPEVNKQYDFMGGCGGMIRRLQWHGSGSLSDWVMVAKTSSDVANTGGSGQADPAGGDQLEECNYMSDHLVAGEIGLHKHVDLDKDGVNTIVDPELYPVQEKPEHRDDDSGGYGARQVHGPNTTSKTKAKEAEEGVDAQELSKNRSWQSHELNGTYKVKDERLGGTEGASYGTEELESHQAVHMHEPDGKDRTRGENKEAKDCGTYEADELDRYRAVRALEPDGKYKVAADLKPGAEGPVYDQEELKQYRAFRSHEPDGKYKAEMVESVAETTVETEELGRYGPFQSHEPDGKYKIPAKDTEQTDGAAYEADGLKMYGACRSHEPDGKYTDRDSNTETTTEPDGGEVGKYGAFKSHEPDGNYAAELREREKRGRVKGLGGFKAFQSHEPDGVYAAGPAAPSVDAADFVPNEGLSSHEAGDNCAANQSKEAGPCHVSTCSETAGKTLYKRLLAELMSDYVAKRDAIAGTSKAQAQRGQGHYVQDFSVDLAKSWSKEMPAARATTSPTEQPEPSSGAVQPPLARLHGPDHVTSSQAPADSDLHVAKVATDAPSSPGSFSTGNAHDPTLYKIFAYDATTQRIDIAETSFVPGGATPLTSAHVLLRLSNPSRFLPIEMVSGSGDVLVYRRVRPASPKVQAAEADAASMSEMHSREVSWQAPSVNPIDMTGGQGDSSSSDRYSVTSGRFASPTRFANLELPPFTATAGQGFGTARVAEETSPVSHVSEAGKKRSSQKSGKKQGLLRRMGLVAAWSGGLAYVIGVVTDYFKTGGSDGGGPRGF